MEPARNRAQPCADGDLARLRTRRAGELRTRPCRHRAVCIVAYGVLLHATARAEKQWPEESWRALTAQLGNTIDLVVPHGSNAERERASRIASASPRARVPERQPLDAVARMIAGASFVVGVDTGLLHLAAAFGVPLVAIFVGSEPGLTGPLGAGPIKVLGANGAVPSLEDVSTAVHSLK